MPWDYLRSLIVRCVRHEQYLPRSGCDSKPRVASTLGRDALTFSNPERVASRIAQCSRQHSQPCRNPVGVDWSTPVLPGLKQPWALGRNRFAVSEQALTLHFANHQPTQSPQALQHNVRKQSDNALILQLASNSSSNAHISPRELLPFRLKQIVPVAVYPLR